MLTLSLRQKELITGVAAPALFFVVFGFGEAALRVVNLVKFGTVETIERGEVFFVDEETGLRLPRPNATMGLIRFSARGFRGPDIEDLPPKHTLRLAFIGSSTTFDGGIPEERTWAAVTTREIGEALPDGCRAEYLNAGLPGYHTPNMHAYFEHTVGALAPHVTIVLPGDVTADNQEQLREMGKDPIEAIKPSLLARHSILWEKIEKNMRVLRLQRLARRGEGFIDFDERRYGERFRGRLDAFLAAIADSGSLPVLVTITGRVRESFDEEERVRAAVTALYYNPYTAIDELITARNVYNAEIAEVAEAHDAILVGEPMSIPGDELHFQDSMHFSATGAAAQGRRVARELLASPRFRDTVRALGGPCAAF